ncbi:MAG: TolC family protein [Chryseolinea sp.]
MKTKIVLSFLFLTLMLSAHAQQPQNALGLQECINIALENNLKIKRSVYNVETYDVNLLQSKMAFLPSVNLGGSYGQNYGRALNPVSNEYVNRNSNTINVQGNASLTLFNGFKLQNTFKQNKKDFEASNEDLKKAKNDVMLNVATLYINVVFNKELYENANYQLNSSQQQLDRISKQVEAGALSLSNKLSQEAQVATNEVNLINQENALNLSLLQLKQAMQVPASQQLDVIVPALDIKDLIISETPDQVYAVAKEVMPEIKSAQLKVQSSKLAFQANRGNLYPKLTFNAGGQSNYSSITNSPELNQLRDNLFKNMNLQLSIPIFNNYQTKGSVQRSFISEKVAEVTYLEAENTLRQSIETSYNDAVAAAKTYTSSLKQVQAQQEAYRMNQQRYENGALSFVEYHVSENDLFRAKSDLTRAKYSFIFRKKVLDFYQGKPLEY